MAYSIDDMRDAEWDYEFERDPDLEVTHEPYAATIAGNLALRQPATHQPACSCGWREKRSYGDFDEAMTVARTHAEEATTCE